MSLAVLEPPVQSLQSQTAAYVPPGFAHLTPPVKNGRLRSANGTFLPGDRGGPGRPQGVKNAEKSFLRAAPRLARAYIKKACAGDPTLLRDARTWIMPDEQPINPSQLTVVVIDQLRAPQPRVLLDVPGRDLESRVDVTDRILDEHA